MDANKRDKLDDIAYAIEACGVCIHAMIMPLQDWGECGLHTYEHQKHTENPRPLSINRHGCCPQFELSNQSAENLGHFVEFVPRRIK